MAIPFPVSKPIRSSVGLMGWHRHCKTSVTLAAGDLVCTKTASDGESDNLPS